MKALKIIYILIVLAYFFLGFFHVHVEQACP